MIEEGSADWFRARTGIVTCSRLDGIMSSGRKAGEPGAAYFSLLDQKAWEVVAQTITPAQSTFAMQRGVELEATAIERYEAHTGRLTYKPGLLIHPAIARFGGTPDALTYDEPRRSVQVKVPFSTDKVVKLRAERDPSEYFAQVQGEMLVSGAAVCDLVIYDDRLPQPYDLTVIEVPADRAYQAQMLERVQRFLADLDARVMSFKGAA
jgi:hypothetical protein